MRVAVERARAHVRTDLSALGDDSSRSKRRADCLGSIAQDSQNLRVRQDRGVRLGRPCLR